MTPKGNGNHDHSGFDNFAILDIFKADFEFADDQFL
jgi:hypothetical protein